MDNALQPPSAQYWFGTDNLGRDILSRVVYGARISVIVGLTGSTIATILSLIIGMISGFVGGRLDLIVQRVVDAVLSIPFSVFLVIVVSITGTGIWPIILALGLVVGIGGSRVIRGAVIGIKENIVIGRAADRIDSRLFLIYYTGT